MASNDSGNNAKRDDANKSPVVEGCFHYFPKALMAVAIVSDFGSRKYGVSLSKKNWMGLEQGRIANSLGRHLLAEEIEGSWDIESGLLHKAHTAWNALAALEKELMAQPLAKPVTCPKLRMVVPLSDQEEASNVSPHP
jgi:hypothetical protein